MCRYMKNMSVSMRAETGDSQQKNLTNQVVVTLHKSMKLTLHLPFIKSRSQSVLCKSQIKCTEWVPSSLPVHVHRIIRGEQLKTNQPTAPRQPDKTSWGESRRNHHMDGGREAKQCSQQTRSFTPAEGASLPTLVPAPHRLEEEQPPKPALALIRKDYQLHNNSYDLVWDGEKPQKDVP